jgi:transcriptional regulator of acetoin/glycerol metabolism
VPPVERITARLRYFVQQYTRRIWPGNIRELQDFIGEPASDHWQSEEGAMQYEALDYPDRKLTVILMGADRKSVLYAGTMDQDWKPVHSVAFRSGGTTDSLLRGLKRF